MSSPIKEQIQEITVSTKGGFLAALECAKCEYDTVITLRRKSGYSTFYIYGGSEDKDINRIKCRTKKIPAVDLLA